MWIFGAVVLMLTALSAAAWYYRDEIINKALDVLKAELNTPVVYKHVDVSIWSSFPLLAINFQDLEIADALRHDRKLISVEQFSLAFNWVDAWNENYHVHQLKLTRGQLNMRKDKWGQSNWEIFKSRPATGKDLSMRLERIIFKEITWQFIDAKTKYEQVVFWDNLKLKGDFSSMSSNISVDADGICQLVRTANRPLIQQLDFECSGDVTYDQKKKLLSLSDIQWEVLDSPMQGEGWMDFKKETCHLEVKADNIEVKQWVDNMPGWISDALRAYEPVGTFQLNGTMDGAWERPEIKASLIWKEGAIKEPQSGVSLEDVDLQLKYYLSKGHDVWHVDHLQANLASGQWKISGNIKNTMKPELDLNVEMHTGIEEMVGFLKWDTLLTSNGQLDVKARVFGQWNPEDSLWRWEDWKAEGNVAIKAERFQWHSMPYPIENVQALLQLHEENAIVHQCMANYQHSDINLTGKWHQAVAWLLNPNRGIEASVVLKSNHIQGEDFLQSEGAGFGLPAFAKLQVQCEVDEFDFQQFEAKQFKTNLTVEEGLVRADAFRLDLADGNLNGSIECFANARTHQWEVELDGQIEKVNLPGMMQLFNNFGQTAIESDQLKGTIDANVDLNFQLSNELKLDRPTVTGIIDMEVNNGEIIHWSVLEDVSAYLKKNKWIAPLVDEDLLAKKLSWVKFEQLRNTISISQQTIEIPWMEIKSSALNMVFKANHTFDNQMDYLMGFHVRDLLLRDPNQAPTEDGKKFFISMKGPVSNLQFAVESDKEWKALFDDNVPQRDRSVKKWLDGKKEMINERREQKREERGSQQNERKQNRAENREKRDPILGRNKRANGAPNQ
jgi:uncharacterized protein involved in outer membrane biogenesis